MSHIVSVALHSVVYAHSACPRVQILMANKGKLSCTTTKSSFVTVYLGCECSPRGCTHGFDDFSHRVRALAAQRLFRSSR
jgi:hypothetical protein